MDICGETHWSDLGVRPAGSTLVVLPLDSPMVSLIGFVPRLDPVVVITFRGSGFRVDCGGGARLVRPVGGTMGLTLWFGMLVVYTFRGWGLMVRQCRFGHGSSTMRFDLVGLAMGSDHVVGSGGFKLR